MNEDERPRSLSRQAAPASPEARLAGIKLDLGIIVLICIVAGIAVLKLNYPNWLEMAGLAVLGFACGGWLAVRTRHVVAASEESEGREDDHGSQ